MKIALPSYDPWIVFSAHAALDELAERLEATDRSLQRNLGEASDVTLSIGLMLTLYDQCGSNTFVLGDRQVKVFSTVDVSKVNWSEVAFPYNGFYLAFEKPRQVQVLNVDGTYYHVLLAGVLVTLLGKDVDANVSSPLDYNNATLTLMPLFVNTQGFSDTDAGPYLRLHMQGTESVEEAIQRYRLETREDVRGSKYEKGLSELIDVLAGSYYPTCLGAIAYLASVDRRGRSLKNAPMSREEILKAAKKARDRKQKRKLIKRATRISNRGRVQMVYPDCPAYEVSPHWRRGHSRHVWVGSRTDEDGNPRKGTHRELRFIPPTLVRRDVAHGAEKGARVYHYPTMRKQWATPPNDEAP